MSFRFGKMFHSLPVVRHEMALEDARSALRERLEMLA